MNIGRYILTFMLVSLFLSGCNNADADSPWVNANINFIGDSITEQGFFEHKEYPKIVDQNLNLKSHENYGVGGSAMCIRNNEFDEQFPPLINRWEDIESADIHFILIGTNDYSSEVPIGNKDSIADDEFNGCLNTIIRGLQENYPSSEIVISTILKRKDNNTEIPLEEYNNAIRAKAQEYDIHLFEGYEIEGLDIGTDESVTDDFLHPNAEGAKIIGASLAEFFQQNIR